MITGYRKESVAGTWRIIEVPEQGLPGFIWTAKFESDDEAEHLQDMMLGLVMDSRQSVIEHLKSHGFQPCHDEPVECVRYRIEIGTATDKVREIRDLLSDEPYDFWVTSHQAFGRTGEHYHIVVEVEPRECVGKYVRRAGQFLAEVFPHCTVTVHQWVEKVTMHRAEKWPQVY